MAPTSSKKRKLDDVNRPRPRKALREKSRFDSDSDWASEAEVNLPTTISKADEFDSSIVEPAPEKRAPAKKETRQRVADKEDSPTSASEDDGMSTSDDTDASSADVSDASSHANGDGHGKKRKRNDPDAFATSISKILASKLSTSKRADPVLARSRSAAAASQDLADARLEVKARHRLREEKKADLDRGRVRDVLGGEGKVAEVTETERRLRKTAQRGVVKLFNAVRAAQVKGEQAAREARKGGLVGAGRREEKVTEMSKQGFLDLLAGGGPTGKSTMLEEA
ncbi:MAG: hypothetical protein M1832_002827 [Thelocarpon impressellum]|nr:MAG: hypothetical protein M1832_002827 [Thelocarpon impressellum]